MPRPTPRNLPKRFHKKWNNPHAMKARSSPGFRRWLRRHGYLSPNFTIAEARCKDGTSVTVDKGLLRNAQNHAFNLEQMKHLLGGATMPVLSWYRTPAYNRQIGGASQSQHMRALATDFTVQWVESVGRSKVDAAADRVFRDGGVGRYPAGSVHFDSRGYRARWTTF